MKSVLIVSMLALSIFGSGSEAQRFYTVKLFEHDELQGRSLPINLSGDGCYNVPPNWAGHASSVDIGKTCVILFSGRNCGERGLRLETQDDVGTRQLQAVDMNDQVSSLRLC